MPDESSLTPHPAFLPPGTVVGPWRVVAWAGSGVHGAVYRVVPMDNPQAPPVALKLALMPRDPRFVREAQLLSRIRHPSVPQLVGSGLWLHPSGLVFPYLAIEWIDGIPLYDWTRRNRPSQAQVLQWVVQLAGALAALHAQGCVHRDVKGANVLVRRSDGRAMLTDFGTGRYPEATTLTPPQVQPGTPAYRAPEAGLFELQFFWDTSARYPAGPADDLYALGVTACRLVTGEYPEFAHPIQDAQGQWHLEKVLLPAALQQLKPPLREPILRLLSLRPEDRGTAAELAQALESVSEPSSENPPQLPAQTPSTVRAPAPAARRSSSSRGQVEAGLLVAVVMLGLTAGSWWLAPSQVRGKPDLARAEASGPSQKEGDSAALGETVAAMVQEKPPSVLTPEAVADDPLPEPQEGQAVPDAKGRCQHKRQVALNGGCWVPQTQDGEGCESLTGQLYKGTCYIPVLPRERPRRPPTSGPTRKAPRR
ncbi:serine/threonine protein kinase [Hyalangium minutum]|nr:serine/threonine-protein kinase [Hyalangium minutum]